MNKIIYYYQTFNGLESILKQNPIIVTDIMVSSIHFGVNLDLSPYIHLNDYPPYNQIFNNLWKELNIAYEKGINIHLMVGGAGGAFTELFKNYDMYYDMLKTLIKTKSIITGINLDIEEIVDIEDVKKLISDLDKDFGADFKISMAPVAYALIDDIDGMGGFKYKDLLNSKEGERINWFNGQFYGCFNFDTYDKVINNGYNENMIVIGMLGNDFDKNSFNNACIELNKIYKKYNNFKGVFIWEYFNSPPDGESNPGDWAIYVKKCFTKLFSCCKKRINTEYMFNYLKIKKSFNFRVHK